MDVDIAMESCRNNGSQVAELDTGSISRVSHGQCVQSHPNSAGRGEAVSSLQPGFAGELLPVQCLQRARIVTKGDGGLVRPWRPQSTVLVANMNLLLFHSHSFCCSGTESHCVTQTILEP